MASTFSSSRLIYRAIEPEQDAAFFLEIQQDVAGFINSNARLATPQGKKDVTRMLESLQKFLLAVVICLKPQPSSSSSERSLPAPTPIGQIHLQSSPPHIAHHRFTEIGVDIHPAYQGRGYGSEAIRWAVNWAFDVAGMHRVAISAFEYNAGACRLYERLGFRAEGRGKEMIFWQGRWWDDVRFAILDREWRALREQHEEGREEGQEEAHC